MLENENLTDQTNEKKKKGRKPTTKNILKNKNKMR